MADCCFPSLSAMEQIEFCSRSIRLIRYLSSIGRCAISFPVYAVSGLSGIILPNRKKNLPPPAGDSFSYKNLSDEMQQVVCKSKRNSNNINRCIYFYVLQRNFETQTPRFAVSLTKKANPHKIRKLFKGTASRDSSVGRAYD